MLKDIQQKTPELKEGQTAETGDQTNADAMSMSDNRSVTAMFGDQKPGKANRKKDPELMRLSQQKQRESKLQQDIENFNSTRDAFNSLT